MTAKQRTLAQQFDQTHTTQYKNLLVSGCSFTWNNSDHDICSWPYYLRDLAGFEEVYDCSQSGGGSNHIFNSTINEIETNSALNPKDTLVIVMWSGLTRTDVIATQDITGPWHRISNYNFNDRFATLSIFNKTSNCSDLENLCQQYKRLVDPDAQIYESLLKIVALNAYLKHKGFDFLFLSWKDPGPETVRIQSPLVPLAFSSLDTVRYLDEYALSTRQKEPDGHPNPNAYLGWTREHLIPYLVDNGLCVSSSI